MPIKKIVFEQIDSNRSQFKNLTYQEFLSKMDKTDLYFNNFTTYLVKNGVELLLQKNKSVVKRYITAEFARQLFDDNKYYQLVLKEDPMVKRVLNKK